MRPTESPWPGPTRVRRPAELTIKSIVYVPRVSFDQLKTVNIFIFDPALI